MSPSNDVKRRRIAALALGTLLASILAIAAWRTKPEPASATLVDSLLHQLASTTTHQLMPRGLPLPETDANSGASFSRRPLSNDEVTRWLGIQPSGSNQYDPQRLFRAKGNLREVSDWPELPAGHWTRVTNSEGAREDHEFPTPTPDVFVLVAGDSHTEGLCDNANTYSNLLELALAKTYPGRSVEVWNTGLSSYSFYNYLGVLESELARKPDVFVTTIFGGNDFYEVLKIQHLYSKISPPARTRSYWEKVTKAAELSTNAMTQGMNQLLYFRENPDQAEAALQAAAFATSEIQRVCKENDIDWIAAYLPSAFDLPFADWAEIRARSKSSLSLSDADFEQANQLADRLLATLRERGVVVLDLRPAFREDSKPLYWKDLHINLHGQEVVARELQPLVEKALARGRRSKAR